MCETKKPVSRNREMTMAATVHEFEIGGHPGVVTVGLYADGMPGEIFIKMPLEGSLVQGLLDNLATMTSIALQHGVPIETIVEKMMNHHYAPCGDTCNKDVQWAASITDYIFRWIGCTFIPGFAERNVKNERLEKLAVAMTGSFLGN